MFHLISIISKFVGKSLKVISGNSFYEQIDRQTDRVKEILKLFFKHPCYQKLTCFKAKFLEEIILEIKMLDL
jgi:hypothetical protein